MIIEIHGGGFKNKGAELMLVSVIKEFSENHPDVKFCINPSINDDKLYCEKYNILQYVKVPKARGGRLFPARFFLNRLLSNFIPKSYCNRNGLVRFKDVDALIDISGVRFSDKASSTAGKNFVLLAKYFNQRGKPVILLPQMFGPFNKFDSLNLVRKMSNEVDLVFTRDKVSYDFLNKFIPMNNHIFQAPDITISNKIKNVEGKCSKNYGCISSECKNLR